LAGWADSTIERNMHPHLLHTAGVPSVVTTTLALAGMLACSPAFAADDMSDAPAPMTTPGMTGPLAANPHPTSFDTGPLGTWYVTGAVTGLGVWQDNALPGDHGTFSDLSNGQVFIQKTSGPVQFFVQAGVYSMPALGTAYVRADDSLDAYYGVVPQAFVKFVANDHFSVIAGKLPTMFGAEYTFTFENMQVERGLLWNQENAVTRGVQATYAQGPVTASLSWNDGFYSNRYNWLSGSLAYALDARNTLTFIAGGNTDQTTRTGTATPLLQNNGQIYNVIYTHASGPWTITPYLQYTRVPENTDIGIPHSASTLGAAVLANYAFTSHFSLAGRAEYIDSSGSAANGTPNLLYGPGSSAWSLTLTPTYQNRLLFLRGEVSYVKARGATPGFAFGSNLDDNAQSRVLIEAGLLF
jgi:hypothetical protein